jgi:phosphoserine phosphatase
VLRVQKWREEAGIDVQDLVYAYGDSSGDKQLLELFSQPTWVNDIDLVVLVA